ncbi:MAG: FecR domain-containing protein [Pseudomonadota bacterium]
MSARNDNPGEVQRLLQRAGRRALPPDDARDQTYEAVHAAWLRVHRRRVRTRHLSLAAGVFICVAGGSLAWLLLARQTDSGPIARVETLSGSAVLQADSGGARTPLQLTRGDAVANGDVIRSASGSRLLLRRLSGLSIHVGPDTEISWQSRNDLRLTRGVIYVDTAGASRGDEAFAVITHAGRIRHLGTRYSVSIAAALVQVRVRDGAVSIDDSRGARRVDMGQELRIAANGEVSGQNFPADAGPWNWLVGDTPSFDIEGRNVEETLKELGAAAGLRIEFATPAVEAAARETVLHGAALRMPARAALDATLLTTHFTAENAAADGAASPRLVIDLR